MKIKSYLKNTMMFLMELKIKSRKYAVVSVIMKNITIKQTIKKNVPLSKPLEFHNMAITIRSVFEEDDKLYPQVMLDNTLYELNI